MKREIGRQRLSPAASAEKPAAAERPLSGGIPAGELHGRLLQVSRLATIGEMSAGIAHELNQPLTAIANYANACDRMLARADADLEDVRGALREIATQAIRAADILRRLRALASSQTMKRQPTDVNCAIEEVRELILADARVHGARVGFELGPQLPRVSIDAAQIQHVILNLVRNGFEALSAEDPSRRAVNVRTRATEDGDVEIAICDTGPGLSPDALGRSSIPSSPRNPAARVWAWRSVPPSCAPTAGVCAITRTRPTARASMSVFRQRKNRGVAYAISERSHPAHQGRVREQG